MNTAKKTLSFLIVFAMILVMFNVVFFAVPFPKTGAAWVEYAFSLLAIIGGAGISYYAFSKGGVLKSKVYGFPVFRMGYIYAAVQLIYGLAICIAGFFAEIPAWIPLVVSVIILGLSAIGVIAADSARDVIEEQEEQVRAATKPMQTFRLDMQYIADSCKDETLKKKLNSLSEKFRYSDPVSCDELKEQEEKLRCEVSELSKLVNSDTEKAAVLADKIALCLADRNRRCKELKGN